MPRLILAGPAAEEFKAAISSLASFSEAAAVRLHSQVSRRLEDLARHPEFDRLRPEYSEWLPNVRSTAVNPLVIFYHQPRPDTVEVVHITDGRQDLPALLGLKRQDTDEDEPDADLTDADNGS